MAAINLLSDKITSIPLVFENGAGNGVSMIPGDTFSASSGSASLGAVVGGTAAAPLLVLTPMVQAGNGYAVTVSDTKGLPAAVFTFNIVPDPALATQMALNSALATTTAQPVPAAPGP